MYSLAQNSVNLPDATGLHPLVKPLRIGKVVLPNRLFLAPMSGITDVPFRKRASQAGAGLVVSEMVASREYVSGNAESLNRAQSLGTGVHMVQLAGRDAYWMGEAARLVEADGADIIDINMGCPAKKVTGGYSGSALMRNLDHALTLIEATVAAVEVPVTLKMRLGWDEGCINAPELAKRAVDAGVQMITVHGRTRCQFYTGKADWQAVAAVRDAIKVPLVVNGDINSLQAAETACERSNADAVMVGRASYGQPWILGSIAAMLNTSKSPYPTDLYSYICDHYEDMLSAYGVQVGVRHARKHFGWYISNHAPNVDHALKFDVLTNTNPAQVLSALKTIFSDVDTQDYKERCTA